MNNYLTEYNYIKDGQEFLCQLVINSSDENSISELLFNIKKDDGYNLVIKDLFTGEIAKEMMFLSERIGIRR